MAIEAKEQSKEELTQQEAEAVLELWAKRQAEGELRSRLNIQDLAETMNLSAGEVERMVATVRSMNTTSSLDLPPRKKVRPINTFLITLAVVTWFGILAGVGLAAYQLGKDHARSRTVIYDAAAVSPPPMAFPTTTIATPSGESAIAAPSAAAGINIAEKLPEGMKVSFGGYQISGEGKATELDGIGQALDAIVRQTAVPVEHYRHSSKPDIAFINAFQTYDGSLVDSVIRFEKLKVNFGEASTEVMYPIANTSSSRVRRLVMEEQRKRLADVSSKARQLPTSSR